MKRLNIGTAFRQSFLSVGIVAAFLVPAPSAPPSPITVFSNVTVITMEEPVVRVSQSVVIRNGRISEVGPVSGVRIPSGARVIDGRGRYLMPGLVDSHVHVHRESDLLLYLANGVTTIRNMKGEPKHLVWRERLRAGQMFGPNLLTTGPFIEGVFSAADAEKIARDQGESGYDFLKIHGDLSLAAYRRLIAIAHSLGIQVVGHLPRNFPFDSVMVTPQASIDHAEEFIYTFFANRVGDTSRLREAATRTKAAGVVVAPTLVAYEQITRQLDSLPVLLRQPEARILPPIERLRWQPENNYYSRNIPASAARGFRAAFRYQIGLVGALDRAGVPLLLGTDAGGPETVIPGYSAIRELELLSASGLSPLEVLRAATINPAGAWHLSRDFGRVAVGSRADLLLLEENPLADVKNVRSRVGVMVRGEWFPEEELVKRLNEVAANYRRQELASDSLRQAGLLAMITRWRSPWFAAADRDAQRFYEYQLVELYRGVLETTGERGLNDLIERLSVSRLGAPFPQEAMTDLGTRYLWKKDFAKGAAIYRAVTGVYPDEYAAHTALGEALLLAKDSTGARTEFQRALTLKPDDPFATSMLRQIVAARRQQ